MSRKITNQATVMKQKKSGTEIISDSIENLHPPATLLSIDPLATVSYSARRVINLGNFETVHIEVGVSLSCSQKDITSTYDKVKEFVGTRLEAEVDEVENYRDGVNEF